MERLPSIDRSDFKGRGFSIEPSVIALHDSLSNKVNVHLAVGCQLCTRLDFMLVLVVRIFRSEEVIFRVRVYVRLKDELGFLVSLVATATMDLLYLLFLLV
jgi:hypothetical protein